MHCTSTDGSAVLPANYTLGKGTATLWATLKTAGNQTITVTDTANSSISGTTATIDIIALPPVASPDSYNLLENGILTVPANQGVLANDTDPGALTLTASLIIGPSHGALTLNPDGSFTYTPSTYFNGTDSFTYKAIDSQGVSQPATVMLNVAFVNQRPSFTAPNPPAVNQNSGPQTVSNFATFDPAPQRVGPICPDLCRVEHQQFLSLPDIADHFQQRHPDLYPGGQRLWHLQLYRHGARQWRHRQRRGGYFTATDIYNHHQSDCSGGDRIFEGSHATGRPGPTRRVPAFAAGSAASAPASAAGTLKNCSPACSAWFTYHISFGDGTLHSVFAGATVVLSHVYTRPGTFTVTVTATNQSGKTSPPITRTVGIKPVAVEPDPFDSRKTSLYVGGTSGNDTILFTKSASGIAVSLNGVAQGMFSTTGPLVVFGQGGHDTVREDSKLSNPLIFIRNDVGKQFDDILWGRMDDFCGLIKSLFCG